MNMNFRIEKIVRYSAILLAFVAVMSFSACSRIPNLTPNEKGGYVNGKTNVVYYPAPDCYEAKYYITEEAVALNDGVEFFAVDGVEDEKWLYSPDFGILLYAEGEKLPTLAELQSNLLSIRLDDGGISKTVSDVEDSAKISEILKAYENGETLEYPGKRANYKFDLKFYSEQYPWIVYTLMFVQYGEDLVLNVKGEDGEIKQINYGKNFIYNRAEDRFVVIGDELQKYIDDYYHNPDAE